MARASIITPIKLPQTKTLSPKLGAKRRLAIISTDITIAPDAKTVKRICHDLFSEFNMLQYYNGYFYTVP
jgi:hypothetical protein